MSEVMIGGESYELDRYSPVYVFAKMNFDGGYSFSSDYLQTAFCGSTDEDEVESECTEG